MTVCVFFHLSRSVSLWFSLDFLGGLVSKVPVQNSCVHGFEPRHAAACFLSLFWMCIYIPLPLSWYHVTFRSSLCMYIQIVLRCRQSMTTRPHSLMSCPLRGEMSLRSTEKWQMVSDFVLPVDLSQSSLAILLAGLATPCHLRLQALLLGFRALSMHQYR